MTTAIVLVVVAVWCAARRWSRRQDPAVAGARRGRRSALLLVVALLGLQASFGAPAFGQDMDCKEAPNPERPGSGMVGAIDPAPLGTGQPGSAYYETGYAGTTWHTYDLGCGPGGVRNPEATVDTWVGNEMFNLGKNIVGATNGLHYALLSGDLMRPLDDLITQGTAALYDSVFTPWFGLAALLLAVILFRNIWHGDLANIGKRGMWALAGLWFASATYLTPLVYTHALDEIVIGGTSAVQAGFLRQVNVDERNALPSVLHENIIYRNWLRGAFGSPDSPQAQQLGRELLHAQAWTKEEVAAGADAGSPEPKKAQYESVAARSGSAYGYFQGVDGSRIGAGVLSSLQSFAYASFPLMAKATILLAQVLLRVLILAGPLIGLVALLYHQILRSVGRVVGATLLNVVVVAALAGLHTLVLTWLFSPARSFSLLTQMMLAALVTIVFFMVGRPMRRLGQMVELSVGTVGGAMPRTPPGIFSRFRGRGERPHTPQDDFWDQVRTGDPDDGGSGGGAQHRGADRSRPEADHPSSQAPGPVIGTAERTDGSSGPDRTAGDTAAPTVLPGPGGVQYDRGGGSRPTSRQALPEDHRASRHVDTAPVADSKWDGSDDDPVLVPSRSGSEQESTGGPRQAEREVVAGKPVWVVYRPSRGLEVSDGNNNPG